MPETNLAEESFGLLVLALGGMALGVAGLLTKRPAGARQGAVVVALFLTLAGGAPALGLQNSVALALVVLASLRPVRVVYGLPIVQRARQRVGTVLASPRFHALALVAAGAGVVAWQVVRLDRDLEREMRQADEMLGALTDPVDLGQVPDRVGLTDAGSPVPLFASQSGDSATTEVERQQLRARGHDMRLIQTGNADLQYN